jgi:hypothetical protein
MKTSKPAVTEQQVLLALPPKALIESRLASAFAPGRRWRRCTGDVSRCTCPRRQTSDQLLPTRQALPSSSNLDEMGPMIM